jgi:hypothetical protein
MYMEAEEQQTASSATVPHLCGRNVLPCGGTILKAVKRLITVKIML